jgi:cholesterol oxidase
VHDLDFDFAVVGSGFGGSVAALRLAQKGHRVVILEKGKRWTGHDFAEKPWQIHRYLWAPAARLFGPQAYTFLKDLMVAHGVGVGGGSLVYANTLVVPPARVFEDPAWSRLGDWNQDLAPHFAEARRMLGATPAPTRPPLDDHLLHLAKSYDREPTFENPEVGVFLGEPRVPTHDPYFDGAGPERSGCIFCGGCMSGCRHNAKNSLDKNYLHLAESLGVKILPEVEVKSLTRESDHFRIALKRSTRIFSRKMAPIRCRGVVLAAGVMGTLPILLRSIKEGALNVASKLVGQRTRTNCEALVGARSRARDSDHSRGLSISAGFSPDEKTHVELVRFPPAMSALGLLSTISVEPKKPWPRWLLWGLKALRHPVRFLRITNPIRWSREVAMLLYMQRYDSHLTLLWKRRGFWPFGFGLQSQLPDGVNFPRSIDGANSMARDLANVMERAEPLSATPEVLFGKMSTAHILGGCPMATNPDDGVVDRFGRVFGVPNLWIADGSIMPGNLSVNPSLTITAMAEWIASHFPAKNDATTNST